MKPIVAVRVLWIVGGLSILLGLGREPFLRASMLKRADQSQPAWVIGGFQPGGIDSGAPAAPPGLPENLLTVNSRVGGEFWRGHAETAWLAARPSVAVAVSGFPQHAGCTLRAEFRWPDGKSTRERCEIENPGDSWREWNLSVPPGATELRIVADDNASDHEGWLGFSRPFVSRSWLPPILMFAQVLGTWALALVLIWCPGLVWTPASATRERALALAIGLGPAILVGIGGLIWVSGRWASSAVVATSALGVLWALLGRTLWRRGSMPNLSRAQGRILTVCALVSLGVTAKASYSRGPEGELYRRTISRTLAVGDRSDSRIPFHVVQVVANHLAPDSPDADHYFSPWTFFSRGPLAGLVATPIVLATGGHPPTEMPDDAWTPFDRTGFAAYRITLIVLASTVVFALFAVVDAIVGPIWALIGGGVLALCPFGVHEMMFTWPKWEATAWLLVSFLFCHHGKPWLGGIAMGIGFLFHPLAALWLPWLALWAGARRGAAVSGFTAAGLRFLLGAAVLVLPWMILGACLPHAPASTHAGQGDFLRYWMQADNSSATWATWWDSRWKNFSNTFLPFWLWYKNAGHPVLNSVYGPSSPWVKFSFVWWNTLPAGLGLATWGLCLIALTRALFTRSAATWLFVIAPAITLVAYWGASTTGLMRECGHPLMVAILAVSCVAGAQLKLKSEIAPLGRVVLGVLLVETLLMLWLTTLLNPKISPNDLSSLDPCYLTVNLGAFLLVAWLLRNPVEQQG